MLTVNTIQFCCVCIAVNALLCYFNSVQSFSVILDYTVTCCNMTLLFPGQKHFACRRSNSFDCSMIRIHRINTYICNSEISCVRDHNRAWYVTCGDTLIRFDIEALTYHTPYVLLMKAHCCLVRQQAVVLNSYQIFCCFL